MADELELAAVADNEFEVEDEGEGKILFNSYILTNSSFADNVLKLKEKAKRRKGRGFGPGQ